MANIFNVLLIIFFVFIGLVPYTIAFTAKNDGSGRMCFQKPWFYDFWKWILIIGAFFIVLSFFMDLSDEEEEQ